MTRGNPPEGPATAPIEDVKLGSRLYLGIRYVKPTITYKEVHADHQVVLLDLQKAKRHGKARKGLYEKFGVEFGS